MTGAGISVEAGIPDFRSAGGMYDTLKPDLLTATPQQKLQMEIDPTYVVEFGMFKQNQFPYLEVSFAKQIYFYSFRNQQKVIFRSENLLLSVQLNKSGKQQKDIGF